jgi:hypothetical protein
VGVVWFIGTFLKCVGIICLIGAAASCLIGLAGLAYMGIPDASLAIPYTAWPFSALLLAIFAACVGALIAGLGFLVDVVFGDWWKL